MSSKNYCQTKMKQLSNFVRKIPKPYDTDDTNQEIRMLFLNRPKAKIAWYYYIIFAIFYCFGINVVFSSRNFIISLGIKVTWLIYLIGSLNMTTYSFAEGFIFYTICASYLLHFFDIFCLFFFAIFLPNGHVLLKE